MTNSRRVRLLIGGALILLLADVVVLRNTLTQAAVAPGPAGTDAYANLPADKRPKIVETGEYVLYLPSELDLQSRHPLLVALSPSADAWSMIRAWQPVVEKHKWLLYASKTSRNGVPYAGIVPPLIAAIKSVSTDYPVDKSRIIATGLSGGGMASHRLAYAHPELFAAVIINTGMMAEDQPTWPHPPRGKIAVFVASPTDFRYEQMKKNRLFLESLGWKTHWIEFPGGHRLAPSPVLEEAAGWLSQEFQGTAATRNAG
jgi:poly(3-hydroxybutyrate) depolymerase